MNKPGGYKKVKWLFGKEIEIPEEWRVVRLSNICDICKSNQIKSDLYVGLEHINQNNNRLIERGHVDEFISNKNSFRKCDVLYGKLRPALNKVWLATEEGYCSTDILPLHVKEEKANPKMLLLILTNHRFLWYAISTSAGTKMPRTSWSDMKKFPIFLPTITEQQNIASILSGVDAAIEATQKVVEKTERLKKGLMQKLLTRGIGHKKFKRVKWLFDKEIEIPEEWRVVRLSNICDICKSNQIKSDLYVGLEHINQNNNRLIERGHVDEFISNKNSFRKCDVLYGKLRPALNKVWLATEEGYCSTDILPLHVKEEKANPKMLLLILTNHRFLWYAISTSAGTKMPRTSWSDMKKFPIFLPTITEQQNIASILSGVDAYIQKSQQYKEKLEILKKGLMQKLLTGQIRVNV